MCDAIAKITDKFSFAYMQEAFIAALLAIATSEKDPQVNGDSGDDDGLEKNILWKEIKKQIKILREEMDNKATNAIGRMSLRD
jgi:transitional endoplasmic reticulum ATPase